MIKKFFYVFITIITTLIIPIEAYSGNGDIIVHVTETGACYHTSDCGALRSDIPMSLEEAHIKGYQRCSKCNPPVYTGTASRENIKEKHISNGGYTSQQNNLHTSQLDSNKKNTKSIDADGIVYFIIIVAFWGMCLFDDRNRSSKKTAIKKQEIKSSNQESHSKNKNNQSSTSRMVYYTPNGNRYHLDYYCSGMYSQNNTQRCSIEKARLGWRKPCQICAKSENVLWKSP